MRMVALQETMKCVPEHVLDAPPLSRQGLPQYSPGPLPDPVLLLLRWQLEPRAGAEFPESSPPAAACTDLARLEGMEGGLHTLPENASGEAGGMRGSANQNEGQDGYQLSLAVARQGSREQGGTVGGPQGTLAADCGLQSPAGQAITQRTRGVEAAGDEAAGTWVDGLMVSAGWLYKWIAGTANSRASPSEAFRGNREGPP